MTEEKKHAVTLITPIRDKDAISEYASKREPLISFPRSGSHWTRRMLAEIMAIKSDIGTVEFGRKMNQVSGFNPPPINSVLAQSLKTPFYFACHAHKGLDFASYRIYLRREFDAVWRSTQRAHAELHKDEDAPCPAWWGLNGEGELDQDACREKWEAHHAIGSKADLVIDYRSTKASPGGTVRAICELTGVDVTDEEVAQAVAAGSKENMLNEQAKMKNRNWNVVQTEDQNDERLNLDMTISR